MLNELAKEIHENAVEHGWWEEKISFGEIVALCHSELSEALEEYRNGHEKAWGKCTLPDRDDCPLVPCPQCRNFKPEGMAVEMADCIIRILDWCGKEGVDIDKVMREKMDYNKTRPYRHGGKVI